MRDRNGRAITPAKAIPAPSEQKPPIGSFKSIAGTGTECRGTRKDPQVVHPGYLGKPDMDITDQPVKSPQAQGKTVVCVLVDGKLRGTIALADMAQPEAKQTLTALKSLDIRCQGLTEDETAMAKWVSEQVGRSHSLAGALPQDKAGPVNEVRPRAVPVTMNGAGLNDAPALSQAHLGVAAGAGSDVAVETADVILVRCSPLDIVDTLALVRATNRSRSASTVIVAIHSPKAGLETSPRPEPEARTVPRQA